MSSPTWQLFISFFKIGALSFGGGPSAISMMQKELTDNTALTAKEFSEGLALGNALPGPIISNMAVYAGLKLGGFSAAMTAVIAAIVPSVLIMGLGVTLFTYYHELPALQAALKAIRPTVIALLAFTIYKLAPGSVFSIDQAAIGVVMFLLMTLVNMHPALAILLSGLVGVLIYR
jgi:chromate transporter